MLRKKRSDQERERTHSGAALVSPAQTEAEDKNPIWGNDKLRSMVEIAGKNNYDLNNSRYVSTSSSEAKIDLAAVHRELTVAESKAREATSKHNEFLKEQGLSLLP